MLSQAQNMGSPTNIQFDLGRGNNQPPPQEMNEQTTPREMGSNDADIAMTANLRPQPLGRGGATATMVQASPYSGFDEALTKWGLSTDTSVRQDLNWQRDVNGDSQKINLFKEIVGGLQEFQTYLLIKPGNAFVTVIHSPMKFVAISEATQHLQGRFVGFVGDSTATKDPTPIVLPQLKT